MASDVIRFGILTVSDRCSNGLTEDKSGPAIEYAIKNHSAFCGIIAERACVADIIPEIMDKLLMWSCGNSCDVVLTTGGTGFAVRDVTPEATLMVVTKRCDALAMMGSVRSPSIYAFLSRAAAGIREKTLIVNLPGSVRGATESFESFAPLLPHAVHLIIGNTEAVTRTHMSHNYDMAKALPLLQAFLPPSSQSLSSSVTTTKSALRPRESVWPMVNLKDAQNIVLESANGITPTLSEVPLMESLGQIAVNCESAVNLPSFRASVKDGYAVVTSDGTHPRTVVSAFSAGDNKNIELNSGECVRINTGASLPLGADAVVQVEDTRVLQMNEESEEVQIEILKSPTFGQDVREIGSDLAMGSVILKSGDKIGSSAIGVLASTGLTCVPCWSVKVCVFSTGDELANIGVPLNPSQVYDSNRHTLISLLKENSFPASDGGIIKDHPNEIFKRLTEALRTHDVIITTGSVSMGDKDYLKQVLSSDLKAKIHFGRIDLKPGKPTTFADFLGGDGSRKLIFSLPGNPVSAAVTCHLLVLPALRKITKYQDIFSPTIQVLAAEDMKFDDTRKEFKRAIVTFIPCGLPTASVTGGQASSRLGSMLEANALISCDTPVSTITKGTTLNALMIGKFRFEANLNC